MPQPQNAKYYWPCSAFTEADMNLLYLARESTPKRIPITRLLVHAVRATYGHLAYPPLEIHQPLPTERREAA
jgi:hypothetical protein